MTGFFKKISLLLVLFVSISLVKPTIVQAAGDFIVNYTVDYTIDPDGEANVVQNIT